MKKALLTIIALFLAALLKAQPSGKIQFGATVYAVQMMDDPASPRSMVNWARHSDGKPVSNVTAPIQQHLTTLHIDASQIDATVVSISIFANSQAAIAGDMEWDGARLAIQAGDAPSIYASSNQSDVVTVMGSSKTCTAYLLPVSLKGGVTVTLRGADGKFYSQNFAEDIPAGASLNLTLAARPAGNLWMSTLPGNTYFSFISTPGAHDAATSGVKGLMAGYAKCQNEDIATMLAHGVRAFDLRPNYKNSSQITADNLYIYHGPYNTNVRYVDAIQTMVDFLKANPSEALSVVMVKEAGAGSTDRSQEMWNVINACHAQHRSYMKLLDRNDYTLDDFRGKICYINRTGTACSHTTRITHWPNDRSLTDYTAKIGSTCYASIQDKYTTSGTVKQAAVKAMLQLSSQNTEKKYFHFNYTSSAYQLFGSAPSRHATTTNPAIARYLNEGHLTGPTGYVYADYIGSRSHGGAALLSAIIRQNFRYVYQGRAKRHP